MRRRRRKSRKRTYIEYQKILPPKKLQNCKSALRRKSRKKDGKNENIGEDGLKWTHGSG